MGAGDEEKTINRRKRRKLDKSQGPSAPYCTPSSSSITRSSLPTTKHDEDPERCPPQVVFQHDIFLSHSGQEKPFVEQLCVDLEKWNHFPFFDQRSDSLPVGETFPNLILQATEQCKVAVIVLSEGFLTSKWPMQELSSFIQARVSGRNFNLKLVPLFYKLEPEDLNNLDRWRDRWKNLVRTPGDIELWSWAVKELKSNKGLRFKLYGNSEVKYREDVVDHVRKLLPLPKLYDTSNVKGCKRLCEATSLMFVSKEACQIQIVGLYGTGGLGKTTTCKAMCNYFQREFRGKLGEIEAEKQLARLKCVLHVLFGLNKKFVDELSVCDEGRNLLKKPSWRCQAPMFLVVDDVGVSPISQEEAKMFVDIAFPIGSKVLVTSKSRDILESILGERHYCRRIAGLEMSEASELLLSKAAPKRKFSSLRLDERVIVDDCARQCFFKHQYHPLALRAFGSYLHENDKDQCNILNWEKYLEDNNKFQNSPESEVVFQILGLGYEVLNDPMLKHMFLDMVVFEPWRLRNLSYAHKYGVEDEHTELRHVASILALVHKITEDSAMMKVRDLIKRGLLNESNTHELSIHDLYKEFVQWKMIKVNDKAKRWLCAKESSIDWSTTVSPELVLRVSLEGLTLIGHRPMKIHVWKNVGILNIGNVKSLTRLDLQGLDCLRILRVVGCEDMEEIVCTCDPMHGGCFCYGSEPGARGCMHQLQIIYLDNLCNLERVPILSHCWCLESLWFGRCYELHCFPYLMNCSKLRNLRLPSASFDEDQGLCITQVLKKFSIDDAWHFSMSMRRQLLSNVMKFTKLTSLDLETMPNWILEGTYLDVSNLVHLSHLNLCRAEKIEEVIGLEQLSLITSLVLKNCWKLYKLPNLTIFPKLKRLCIRHCGPKLVFLVVPAGVQKFHSTWPQICECLNQTCKEKDYCPKLCYSDAFDGNAGEPSFDNLELEYDYLNKDTKLIFLDLALSESFYKNNKWDTCNQFEDAISFIAMLHGTPKSLARTKVEKLQTEGFLTKSKTELSIHGHHKQFAQWLIKENKEARAWYLIWDEESKNTTNLEWLGFSRVKIHSRVLKRIYGWQTVVFLDLFRLEGLSSLNLQGLMCLRILKVEMCCSLEEIVCTYDSVHDVENQLATRGSLHQLLMVHLEELKSLTCVSFLIYCWNLETLWFTTMSSFGGFQRLGYLPNLSDFLNLKSLQLPSATFDEDHYVLHAFTTTVKRQLLLDVMNLTTLNLDAYLDNDYWDTERTCVDVSKLVNLSILTLSQAKIQEVGGLEQLSQLTSLVLRDCYKLHKLPDLTIFPKLERLCIKNCLKLASLFVPTRVHAFHSWLDCECLKQLCMDKNCSTCPDWHDREYNIPENNLESNLDKEFHLMDMVLFDDSYNSKDDQLDPFELWDY